MCLNQYDSGDAVTSGARPEAPARAVGRVARASAEKGARERCVSKRCTCII